MSWYCVDRWIQVKSFANLEFQSNCRKVQPAYSGVEIREVTREEIPWQPPGCCRVSSRMSPSWAWQAATGMPPKGLWSVLQASWEVFLLFLPEATVAGHGKVSCRELLVSSSWPCPRQLLSAWKLPPTSFLCDGTGSHSHHVGSNMYLFSRKSLLCWFVPVLTWMVHQFSWMSLCESPRPAQPHFGHDLSQSQTPFTCSPPNSDIFFWHKGETRKFFLV